MPTYLIKPDPDEDFYAMYSTVVDNMVAWGTRAELEDDYKHEPLMVEAERFERADRNGTSAMWDGDNPNAIYGFNDQEFMIREIMQLSDEGWIWDLPRKNIKAYCEATAKKDWLTVRNFLTLDVAEDD